MKKRSFTLTPPDSRLIKVNGRRPSLKTPSARWAVASGRPGSHGFWLRQTGNVWYGKPETDSSDVWSTTVVGGFDFSVFSGACCEWCIIYIYSTQYAHAHTHTHAHTYILLNIYSTWKKKYCRFSVIFSSISDVTSQSCGSSPPVAPGRHRWSTIQITRASGMPQRPWDCSDRSKGHGSKAHWTRILWMG